MSTKRDLKLKKRAKKAKIRNHKKSLQSELIRRLKAKYPAIEYKDLGDETLYFKPVEVNIRGVNGLKVFTEEEIKKMKRQFEIDKQDIMKELKIKWKA